MHASLPLHGEAPASRHRPPWAIAAKGFRPFFLLAAVFAVAIVPLWLLALEGLIEPGSYLGAAYWHAHEMVFGFAVAVIAGFLLTAVGNWTARETVTGPLLLVLAGLWVAGRVAFAAAASLPRGVAAAVDLAFLPALIVAVARPILAAANRRNLVMVGVLSVLFLANAAMHLDALGVLPGARRPAIMLAVDVVVFVLLVISGRVFPMFTRNATDAQSIRSHPALDRATLVAMGLLVGLDAALPASRATAVVAAATAVLATARAAHWGASRSARQPLLWVLHLGYAWIPVGLMLRAASAFTEVVPPAIATHALTVGAIGTLTLGMMARVTLGHTGRALTPPRAVCAAFGLIAVASLARVVGPLAAPLHYRGLVIAAGAAWSAAFALYLVAFAPALCTPRPDGKQG